MRNTLIDRAAGRPRPARATAGPWRASIEAGAVVLLVVLLLIAAITAALQPHPLVEPTQAAAQGGL